jgi:hypothetical protein
MNIQIDEEKRRIILKAWRNLAASLESEKLQDLQIIKQDIEKLIHHLEHADISKGIIPFTQEQMDGFAHVNSYLGDRWKPENALGKVEFIIYNRFLDAIYEEDSVTDKFLEFPLNESKRAVILKFLKVIYPLLETSQVPLIANKDFMPDTEELIKHFEGLSLPSHQDLLYKFNYRYYFLLASLINFSNSQQPTEVFLNEEEDDLFWDMMAETDDLFIEQTNKEKKESFIKFLTLVDRVVPPNAGEDGFVQELIEDLQCNDDIEAFIDLLKKQHQGEGETFLNADQRLKRFYQYFNEHQRSLPEYSAFPEELYQKFEKIDGSLEHLKRYFIRMAIDENNERYVDDKTYIFDELRRLGY